MAENKYVERLVKEWKEHGRIVLSIDFDSTISYWPTIDNQDDIDKVIDLIKRVQAYTYNVIFTACAKDRFPEIEGYCKTIGVRVDAINQNPITLPYGNNGKIFYNLNICDRSGLNEALSILSTAYYIYRGFLENQKSLDEIG